jgi:hypothetical protein
MENNDINKVVRVIEYYGTPEWIEKTLSNGLIPNGDGEVEFPNGCKIKSYIQEITKP